VSRRREVKVRIGVVGLGYWGPNLARNIADSSRTELAWLCDLDAQILSSIARRYPDAKLTTDVATMLADPDLDAVVIATPISTHHALASAALAAKKHVWVEKPLASSSRDASDLVQRAEASNLILLPGHTFLYSPPVVKIKEFIDGGDLGEIYFVSMSRVNLGLHQPDASVLWDLAPHDFSILRYWLDDLPAEVSGMTRACVIPDTPDVAFVNMRFAGGAIAHLELSWLSPSKLRRTTIIGSEKMIMYDDTSHEPVRIFDSGASLRDPESFEEYRPTYRSGDIVSPRIDATEPLALEVDDFCSAILDGKSLRSSTVIGLDVVCAIEAVERSIDAGGGLVTVKDAHTVEAGPARPARRSDRKPTARGDGAVVRRPA
jgi:predicted dehydrogenase